MVLMRLSGLSHAYGSALQRLGDPRWIEPVCATAARPASVEVLAGMVGHWGPDAADLVPDLLAAMPYAGPQAAEALRR